eukprot:4287032-Amphidinium_carterae.1
MSKIFYWGGNFGDKSGVWQKRGVTPALKRDIKGFISACSNALTAHLQLERGMPKLNARDEVRFFWMSEEVEC